MAIGERAFVGCLFVETHSLTHSFTHPERCTAWTQEFEQLLGREAMLSRGEEKNVFNHTLSMWIMCFKAQLWTKNGNAININVFGASSMHWTGSLVDRHGNTLIRYGSTAADDMKSERQKCRTMRPKWWQNETKNVQSFVHGQRLAVQANRIRSF